MMPDVLWKTGRQAAGRLIWSYLFVSRVFSFAQTVTGRGTASYLCGLIKNLIPHKIYQQKLK